MSDQPIIIQQPFHSLNILENQNKFDDTNFYELLDQVEDYDSKTSQIRQLHQQAMLELADIKFIDQHSLKVSAHRCLPAFLTLSQNQKLQNGYVAFTKDIDEDVYFEEYDQQQQIGQMCIQKQKQHHSKLSNDQNEQKAYSERELLYRFNVLNQQNKIINTAAIFRQLLDKLLDLARTKNQINQHFIKLEQQQ